jgi:hypothetical protein
MSKNDLKYDENTYGGIQVKPVKLRKIKYQCNACGHIDYLLKCPKCGGGMFKYINKL